MKTHHCMLIQKYRTQTAKDDVSLNEKNLTCKLQCKYLDIKHQHQYKYLPWFLTSQTSTKTDDYNSSTL